jgi:hypothetical protein
VSFHYTTLRCFIHQHIVTELFMCGPLFPKPQAKLTMSEKKAVPATFQSPKVPHRPFYASSSLKTRISTPELLCHRYSKIFLSPDHVLVALNEYKSAHHHSKSLTQHPKLQLPHYHDHIFVSVSENYISRPTVSKVVLQRFHVWKPCGNSLMRCG